MTKWERISETATLLEPALRVTSGETTRNIAILGSGYSVSTNGPIEGEVVIVESIEELEDMADDVRP